MRHIRIVIQGFIAALMMLWAPSIAAKSKGIEIRSENFIVRGDVSEKNAKRLVKDLELFRSNIFKLLETPAVPEVTPVHIFVTDQQKTFHKVNGGNKTIAGVYNISLEGPAFALSGKGGFKRGDYARHTALHEYTHHLIAAHTNLHFPLWYNEGFANFLSTYDNSKKSFIIGRPYQPYGYSLSRGEWLPMEYILRSVHRYPFKSGDGSEAGRRAQRLFYAQSWLAVHYLQNNKTMALRTRDYIQRLNRGEKALTAFEAAYNMTPAQFGAELKKYFKSNRFSTIRFKITDAEANPEMKIRRLSKNELDMAAAETWRYFHKKDEAEALESMLNDLSVLPETSLAAYISKSKEALTHEKYMPAVEAGREAVKIDAESFEAKKTLAIATVEAYLKFGRVDGLDITEARDALFDLAEATSDPRVHYYYALSYMNSKSAPPQAAQSAYYAARRYRSVRFIWHRMQMARILIKGNKYGEARKIAKFAKVWGRNKSLRNSAQYMIDYIDKAEAGYK